jgi:hypothetical protein
MDGKKFKFLREDITNKSKPLRPISGSITKTENPSPSPINNNKRHVSKGYKIIKIVTKNFPI